MRFESSKAICRLPKAVIPAEAGTYDNQQPLCTVVRIVGFHIEFNRHTFLAETSRSSRPPPG